MRNVCIIGVCTLMLNASGMLTKASACSVRDAVGGYSIFNIAPGLGNVLNNSKADYLFYAHSKVIQKLKAVNAIIFYMAQRFNIEQREFIGDCSTGGPASGCL
jgi:hypothetical protein